MKNLRAGDRVRDDFLGEGTVESFIKDIFGANFMVVVKFDADPPIRYNMGQNPCAVFPSSLERV